MAVDLATFSDSFQQYKMLHVKYGAFIIILEKTLRNLSMPLLTVEKLKTMIENQFHVLLENKRELMRWISSQDEQDRAAYLSASEKGLKVQHLSWIKRVKGSEPIEDIIPDVIDFLDRRTQQVLKSNGYETDLNTRNYPTVNSLTMKMQQIENSHL